MKVSVVIPAFNEEKLLGNCLKSLLNQAPPPDEIIVVDNASTDKTAQIAKKYKAKVVKELRKGVIFAKQAGVLAASSEIIAIIDADSTASPGWIKCIKEQLADPKSVAVSGPFYITDGPAYHRHFAQFAQKLTRFWERLLNRRLFIPGANIAFCKSVFIKFGGFDITKTMGEDEFGLLQKLSPYGQVAYSPQMIIHTSGRRASDGPISLIYQLLFQYQLNYWFSKIFRRNLFGPFKDYR